MFSGDVSVAVDMTRLDLARYDEREGFPKKHVHKLCEDIVANK